MFQSCKTTFEVCGGTLCVLHFGSTQTVLTWLQDWLLAPAGGGGGGGGACVWGETGLIWSILAKARLLVWLQTATAWRCLGSSSLAKQTLKLLDALQEDLVVVYSSLYWETQWLSGESVFGWGAFLSRGECETSVASLFGASTVPPGWSPSQNPKSRNPTWANYERIIQKTAATQPPQRDQQHLPTIKVSQECRREPRCGAAVIGVDDEQQWAEDQETTGSHVQPQRAKWGGDQRREIWIGKQTKRKS